MPEHARGRGRVRRGATMRAAVQRRYGPPSVLEVSEVGLPTAPTPSTDAADALRYVGAGHTRGKVVVTA